MIRHAGNLAFTGQRAIFAPCAAPREGQARALCQNASTSSTGAEWPIVHYGLAGTGCF
jgi:hypothetical protein